LNVPASGHRSRVAMVVVLAACLALAACGGSSSSTSTPAAGSGASTTAAPTTLHIAFGADMQVPDPDIFYELEGNAVTTSVYEGLIRYKPDSNKFEGALATKWVVSPDGKTYTFTLRPNVKFHDGTTMDSTAVEKSFQRRTAVNSSPAYMLADVASYATPNPMTFVVKLKNPVSPFLDYLAAPYGPKVDSPTEIAAHAGTDEAQSWLKSHDAGTGPYTISSFVPGSKYVLTAFDGYWGPKPYVREIDISIQPSISTQELDLESGQLDMILHGLPTPDVQSLQAKGFEVHQFPANLKTLVFVNENKGIFKSAELRTALRSAIDKTSIVSSVYGSRATVSNQIYPTGELPTNLGADTPTYDPSKLKNLVSGLSDKSVELEYDTQDPTNQRVADEVQAELQSTGLDVSVRGIPISQVFALPTQPKQAPDLLIDSTNPDAAHPDTWIRIYMNTKGALNYLLCSVPAADTAMDQGLSATDPSTIATAYGKAGDLIAQSGCFDTIADVKETVVARKGYTNYVHQLPTLFTIRFGDLQAAG
jgi:peptide/nickel transport system substrate-binding protein